MPTQPVLQTGALPDKVITMLEQKPKILLRLSAASRGQTRLSPSCLGNGAGIDGIGLAAATRATPSKAHELGRDTDSRFPF